MKVGFRKPSIKKSIKARTTGRIKRSIKRTVNPMYGKKGMGWVKDPKKAMYNKVYNKTTIGVSDLATTGKRKASKSKAKQYGAPPVNGASPRTYGVCGVIMKIIAVCTALLFGLPGLFGGMYGLLIFAVLLMFVCWKIGARWTAWGNLPEEDQEDYDEDGESTYAPEQDEDRTTHN
jgi:hypothetical protein